MDIGGYKRELDYSKLGPALMIASSLILAIRTARWPAIESDRLSSMEWQKEVQHSIFAANMALSKLTRDYASLFQHKDVPWYVPNDDDCTNVIDHAELA